jgi:hypothetical protein
LFQPAAVGPFRQGRNVRGKKLNAFELHIESAVFRINNANGAGYNRVTYINALTGEGGISAAAAAARPRWPGPLQLISKELQRALHSVFRHNCILALPSGQAEPKSGDD